MTDESDLPLFRWRPPPCQFIAFPLTCRIGRIRDVASKLQDKTDRHATYYREQTAQALTGQLLKIGLSPEAIEKELAAFWVKVNAEIVRRSYAHHRDPGGAA
ncbi:DUF6074 family protein [Pararhizobium sp. BT-229]|uniref:DUF6074 family protein n=1 Tax=Pararhizobium sp. BT-229 TaxID=2986923 RepID=UPI0021F6BD8E|nr:DUF6074 family protein [Pararhizobium sp. BT-229]MCV9960356.1 DUF6074 family protein [Pararhizobium sp. BT-229]